MSLICLPLLGQVTLVAVLALVLSDSQTDYAKVTDSRLVLSQLHAGMQHFTVLLHRIAAAGLSAKSETLLPAYESIRDAGASLHATADSLRARNDVDAEKFALLTELSEVYARESLRSYAMHDSKLGTHFLRELQEQSQSLFKIGAAIRRRHTQIDRAGLEKQIATRRQLEQIVIVGGLANVLLSCLLALWFYGSSLRRIKSVAENTRRLSQRESLLEPSRGNDEIAQVDRLFHEMATTITDALDQLSASERTVRSIIEGVPQPLLTLSAAGQVESLTPAAVKAFGFTREELLATNIKSLLKTEGHESVGLAQFEQSKPERLLAVRQDGTTFPVEVTVTELANFETHNLLACVKDVTEQASAEKWRDDFVAMVSHDLRTPLNSISLSLECFLRGLYGQPSGDARTLLESAHANCKFVVGTVTDLLNVNRMKTDRRVSRELLELDGLIGEALADCSEQISAAAVKIDFEKSFVDVMGDGAMLLAASKLLIGYALARMKSNVLYLRTTASAGDVCLSISGLSPHAFDLTPDFNSIIENATTEAERFRLQLMCNIFSIHNGSLQFDVSEDSVGLNLIFRNAQNDLSASEADSVSP